MCRWLERDPAGYQDGPSLYSYLGRNPLAGTDPYGLEGPPTPSEEFWRSIGDSLGNIGGVWKDIVTGDWDNIGSRDCGPIEQAERLGGWIETGTKAAIYTSGATVLLAVGAATVPAGAVPISEAVAGGVVAATAEAAGPVALTVARGRLLNLMIAVLCWEEVARNDGQGAGLALLLTILAFIEGPAGPAVKAADDVGAAAASGSATVTEVLAELQAGRSAGVKVVESDEALEALYARLSAGGQVVTPKSYPGQMVVLPNGMRIGLRVKSKSGGMTIDVFPVSGNPIKVHVRK